MLSRSKVGMMLLALTALGAAEPQETSQPRLRQDGPSLSPEEAKALTPQALGDALLAPGHLPVLEVAVGPQGMEPPPPPGGAVPTRVKLYLQPVLSEQSGFCQRTVATTYIPPADRSKELGGRQPNGLKAEVAYRWIGYSGAASACNAPMYKFFTPSLEGKQRALEAVRLLASASQAARQGSRIPFPLSVQDKEGPEMLAYQREHPELSPIPDLQVITNAKKALASLPVDAVTFAGSSATASPDILLASDLTGKKNPSPEGVTIFLGGDWTVGLVILEGRIVRIRLLRQIPPPF